jgi:hypothetical protein
MALESGRNYLARRFQAQNKTVLLDSVQFWSTEQFRRCSNEWLCEFARERPCRKPSRGSPFREAL